MASIPLKSDDSLPPRRGIIFILSAPSGAGKTTIYREALKAIKNLEFSISLTTRVCRKNEADGIDYSFVGEEEFNRRQSSGELAEWARAVESSYGPPGAALDAAIAPDGRGCSNHRTARRERRSTPRFHRAALTSSTSTSRARNRFAQSILA